MNREKFEYEAGKALNLPTSIIELARKGDGYDHAYDSMNIMQPLNGWWHWWKAGRADLADAMDVQTARSEALAAENGQMLRLLTDISENHLEYLSEGEDCMMAGVPLDYVSEVNMYVSRDVNAENPFQATDAFLAETRAQGVGEAINCIKTMMVNTAPAHHAVGMLHALAAQLRGNSNGGAL